MEVSESELNQWGSVLCNPNEPLTTRFRALWGLKHAKENLAIDLISKAFNSKSELLKHELAYCLGQKKNEYAISALIKVLKDETQEPIVRHEAGEALAAIGNLDLLDLLKDYSKSDIIELAETCYLGYKRLEFIRDNGFKEIPDNEFDTIDPAPEYKIDEKTVEELKTILLNPSEDLFERYRAMFSLRRIANGTTNKKDDALDALCKSIECPSSGLFRHEVGFVLGQLANPRSFAALKKSVENTSDYGMVRHESAEALGAIGDERCQEFLKQYLQDPAQVVAESCVVALDIADYKNSENYEQYAFIPKNMK